MVTCLAPNSVHIQVAKNILIKIHQLVVCQTDGNRLLTYIPLHVILSECIQSFQGTLLFELEIELALLALLMEGLLYFINDFRLLSRGCWLRLG